MTFLTEQLKDLWPGISEGTLNKIEQGAVRKTFEKKGQLLNYGERWKKIWLVEKGALRTFYLNSDGKESNKNFFLEGHLLWPVTSTLRNRPVDFYVASIEDSVVYEMSIDFLEDILRASREWKIFQLLTLQTLLDEKIWKEQLFLHDAEKRYLQFRLDRPQWCQRLPLNHQASWLGISDVSLSRLRRSLGLIA